MLKLHLQSSIAVLGKARSPRSAIQRPYNPFWRAKVRHAAQLKTAKSADYHFVFFVTTWVLSAPVSV